MFGRISAAATICAYLWFTNSTLADPLHKVGSLGAYQHEDSGWLFPKETGAFVRVAPPYTIDGNNDAGARYELVVDGVRSAVAVDVYAADSGAVAAKLDGAKAAVQRGVDPAAPLRVASEEPFRIASDLELAGTKVTFLADGPGSHSQTVLYFMATQRWVVNIVAFVPTEAAQGVAAIDRFVREQPWHTLGSNSPDLHGAAR